MVVGSGDGQTEVGQIDRCFCPVQRNDYSPPTVVTHQRGSKGTGSSGSWRVNREHWTRQSSTKAGKEKVCTTLVPERELGSVQATNLNVNFRQDPAAAIATKRWDCQLQQLQLWRSDGELATPLPIDIGRTIALDLQQ